MEDSKPTTQEKEKEAKKLVTLVYILQALGFIIGFTFIAAVIINYIKREELKGTWLESHVKWQICTFWFGLMWAIIGCLTIIVGIGLIILIANTIWVIYRITKGWLYLHDNKPIGKTCFCFF